MPVLLKHFFLYSGLLLIISFPLQASAFGVSPSEKDFEEVFQGETLRSEFIITTNPQEKSLISGYTLASKTDKKVMSIPDKVEFPDQDKNFVTVPVTINTDALSPGKHEIKIDVIPTYIDRSQMVNLSISLPLTVTFNIVDTPVKAVSIEHAFISEDSGKTILTARVKNDGNATAYITNATLTLPEKTISQGLNKTVLLRGYETIAFPIDTGDISVGDHTVILKISGDGVESERTLSYKKVDLNKTIALEKPKQNTKSSAYVVAAIIVAFLAYIGIISFYFKGKSSV